MDAHSALDESHEHLHDIVAAIAHVTACLARNPEWSEMASSLAFLRTMEAAWHEKYALSTSVASSNDDALVQWFLQWNARWQAHKKLHDWRTKSATLQIPMPHDASPFGAREKASFKRVRPATRWQALCLLVLLATLLALRLAG